MRTNQEIPEYHIDWIPWGLAALYAVVYGFLGSVRYITYHASCDDGLFAQSISTVFHGFHNTPEGASHFAYHFSPILYLLAPLLWVWKSALVLIITQAIAGALTIPPIYAIARRRIPASLAAFVAIIVALYPPLGGVTFSDFSEDGFALAAAAWLIWAIDSRRMPAAISFALICLGIKEDQAVVLAALGVTGAIYFYRLGDKRWAAFALGLTALSIATLIVFMKVVRPASGVSYGYPSIRDFYGGMNPLALLQNLFTAPKVGFVFAILLPLLAICLLSRCMLLAIPGLLECLLSRVPITYTIGQHYAAIWVPYVLASFAIGVSVLWRRFPNVVYPLLTLSLAISVFINVAASPNLWAQSLSRRSEEHEILDRFIAGLPNNSSITAFCPIYAHLGMYPNATVYAKSPTTFIVTYPQRDVADWDAEEQHFIIASRKYYLVLDVNGLKVFKRKSGMQY